MELDKKLITVEDLGNEKLETAPEINSIIYHDIFDYPLTEMELIKWFSGENVLVKEPIGIRKKDNYYFLEGREGMVLKRLLRQRASERKMKIAKTASRILGKLPSVKMVGITGALAMRNASEESDIDLLIVTKRGELWTTRAIALLVFKIAGLSVRRKGDKEEKDKLCLNMWLDETDLVFRKRNIYTAHEIAQIEPLVNKDKTYEKLLYKNRWIKNFWPNAVKIKKLETKNPKNRKSFNSGLIENTLRKFQHLYMKRKITKETITPTRALFHPVDWSEFILKKFN